MRYFGGLYYDLWAFTLGEALWQGINDILNGLP